MLIDSELRLWPTWKVQPTKIHIHLESSSSHQCHAPLAICCKDDPLTCFSQATVPAFAILGDPATQNEETALPARSAKPEIQSDPSLPTLRKSLNKKGRAVRNANGENNFSLTPGGTYQGPETSEAEQTINHKLFR